MTREQIDNWTVAAGVVTFVLALFWAWASYVILSDSPLSTAGNASVAAVPFVSAGLGVGIIMKNKACATVAFLLLAAYVTVTFLDMVLFFHLLAVGILGMGAYATFQQPRADYDGEFDKEVEF